MLILQSSIDCWIRKIYWQMTRSVLYNFADYGLDG